MTGEKEPFGKRLNRLMESKNLNQTQFAEKVGIDRTQLNRTINGKRKPKPQECEWYAEVLGEDVQVLVENTDLSKPLADKVVKMATRQSEQIHSAINRAVEAEAREAALKRLLQDEQSRRQEERKQHTGAIKRRDIEIERLRIQETEWRREATKWQEAYRRAQKKLEHVMYEHRTLQKIKRNYVSQLEALKNEARRKNGEQWLVGVLGVLTGVAIGSDSEYDEE